MTNIKWLGILFLVLGFFFLWLTIKNWTKGKDIMAGNTKGLVASITFIIIGITLLIGK